ncbi:sterile alpha motif domain-containing protein 1-like [Bactrocera neohumeralis]|uniref:sterile alpha motif domain-containing protein 1-like n=1 Tax=Bactrocera neohumeralis TaxID=98809 RepID=UPI0021659559|nr:sterile alpha motif domain-containing protein 1-like [Bactrocera neohumeralis]
MDTQMNNQHMRAKTERTTQEQLQHYVMFCKQHPELQRGKLTPTNPQGLQILWSELADNLNALRGPSRSAAKWKESLMHWKHQLRSRARKLKTHAQATGGGPPISGMTPFEEQAITTFGAAAVDGLPGVATLGHQVLPLYINTQAPASSLAVASPAPAPTPTVASPVPASSLAVTSPAPAFPTLSINFSSPSPHFSSSPSPPSSSLSPPTLSSPMPSSSYIHPEKLTAAKMLGTVLKKWRTEKSERRRPLLYKGKL